MDCTSEFKKFGNPYSSRNGSRTMYDHEVTALDFFPPSDSSKRFRPSTKYSTNVTGSLNDVAFKEADYLQGKPEVSIKSLENIVIKSPERACSVEKITKTTKPDLECYILSKLMEKPKSQLSFGNNIKVSSEEYLDHKNSKTLSDSSQEAIVESDISLKNTVDGLVILQNLLIPGTMNLSAQESTSLVSELERQLSDPSNNNNRAPVKESPLQNEIRCSVEEVFKIPVHCNCNINNEEHGICCTCSNKDKTCNISQSHPILRHSFSDYTNHEKLLHKNISPKEKNSSCKEVLTRQHSMFEASSTSPKSLVDYRDDKLSINKKHLSDPGCPGDANYNCTLYFSDTNAEATVASVKKAKKVIDKRPKCMRSMSARYLESQESTDDEKGCEPLSHNPHQSRRRRNLSPPINLFSHEDYSLFQDSQFDDDPSYHQISSRNISPAPSSLYNDSDCYDRGISRSSYETRRYSKRPLRGPYGEMLEAEMNKVKPCGPLQGEDLLHRRDDKSTSPFSSPPVLVSESDKISPTTIVEDCVATFRLQVSPFQPLDSPLSFQCEKSYEVQNLGKLFIPTSATQPSCSGDRLSPLPLGPIHQRTASSPSKLCLESEFEEHVKLSPHSSLGYVNRNEHSAIDSNLGENNYNKLSLSADISLATSKHEKGIQVQNSRRNQEEILHLRNQEEALRLLAHLMLKTKNSNVDFRFLNEHRHLRIRHQDTRAHIIEEIYETEKNYVDNLSFLLKRYQLPLRNSDSGSIIENTLCDDIFFQIPEIYTHHERLLKELKLRLQSEESTICVGDLLLQWLKDPSVIDSYKNFVNNWKTAQEATKIAAEVKPSFKNFLLAMAKEHPGKLDLKALLIAPVQRFPHYELILKRLLDHTFEEHPDYALVQEAISEVQKVAASINDIKQEALQLEQQQFTLKEIENSIEGLVELVQPERSFLQLDQVTHNSALGLHKERCLFLFSDILVISSIKRRSLASRKSSSLQMTLLSSLDSCKLKLFKFISLDDLEIGRSRDESIKKLVREIDNLEQDIQNIGNISRLSKTLYFPSGTLDDAIQEHDTYLKKQLMDRQGADSPLFELELIVTSQEGIESLTFMFSSAEKRNKWEEAFNVAKQKLSMSADRRPPPEFVTAIPIRKTRAGLQFTCASPSLGCNAHNLKDVWVCNSDGYVGQVCVISLLPEPMIACCSGVCNAKILSIASIPAAPNQDSSDEDEDEEVTDDENFRKRRSESLPPEIGNSEVEKQQATMWLGTEDGSIHVYNCNDAIRSKKNKFKFQPGSPVHCLIYIENRVFASLANGDIIVYERDTQGGWSSGERQVVNLSTAAAPVTKMVIAAGKLWCCVANIIKILNINTLDVEDSFGVGDEMGKGVACIVSAGHGVWVALHSSAAVRLYHATSHEVVCEVNITSGVAKMLASCDDIIRQHKLACLKVTSLLACKDLLWVGTSAGVIITLPILRFSHNARRLLNVPTTVGIPHGHTGNVRFLTSVELTPESRSPLFKYHSRSFKGKDHTYHHQLGTAAPTKLLVISGGDGYEDFRNAGLSELAGKDDSTNHLLMWRI